MNMNSNKEQIVLPSFKTDQEYRYCEYQHVYREGGFRIQQQNLLDKYIFHNYGQGDAELSLSYGSAYIASKIITVKQDASKIKEVAVMGNGINALMTSLQLLKRGYKVTLYSTKFPIKNLPDHPANLEEGLQFWYPSGYDNSDPLKHELLGKLSFEFFNDSLLANRYQSLKYGSCYLSPSRLEDLKENVTEYINSNINLVKLGFGNQKIEEFINYKTILVDTRLFMQEIFTEIRLRNITLVEKKFSTIEDVMSLKEKCIFNCLGEEIKNIFDDKAIQVTKGSFYTIKCTPNQQYENLSLWISSQVENQEDYTIAVWRNRLQIGNLGTKLLDSQKLKEISERILTRAYHFIKERSTKPYKL